MGNCAATNKKHNLRKFSGDTEPEDTVLFKDQELPERTFVIAISNVKLKNLPYDVVSLSINMSSIPEIKLDKKKVEEGVAKWSSKEQKLQMKLTEYQLRREWITISLFFNELKVSELRLNLYKIATGPAHITFPLELTNKMESRLSMDVFVREWVNIFVQTMSADVYLDEVRPEEYFNFTIRTITRSDKDEEESEASYPEKTIASYEMEKGRTSHQEDAEHRMVWVQKSKDSLPQIERKVLVSDLSQSSLQFMVWECHQLDIQEDDVLAGECYISLSKSGKHGPTQGFRDNRKTFIFKGVVNEKLWLNGKSVGRVKLGLRIEIYQHMRQNLMYVRTEMGNQIITPIIDNSKQRVECPEITELQALDSSIERGIIKIHSIKKSETLKIQDAKAPVVGDMAKLLTILESSKKESMRIYIYKSEKDLLHGQQCLLNIGFKMLERLEGDESLTLNEFCWNTLIALIRRGELSLLQTGFSEEEKTDIQNNKASSHLKGKFDFSINYQEFLFSALNSALRSMEEKNLEAVERKFVEFFCAFCYLRVPEFREQLLSAITKKSDVILEEWRGIEVNHEDYSDSQIKFMTDPSLSKIYDWDNNFHNVIKEDSRSKQNYAKLVEILHNAEWRERMEKRGIAFFLFLGYMLEYIQVAAVISINIKWAILPGYNKLVTAVLCEMDKRNLLTWPDSLKEVSTKMLANESLLNVFVTLVLKKINLMEFSCVISGLQIISGYFKYLSSTNRKIHTTFNYLNFLDSVKVILNHEHSFSAAVCLKLLYDHYNMFAAEFKRELSQFLLGKAFFRLFLNWSSNIRSVFHHLLLFRLVLQSNRLPSQRKAIEYGTNSEIKRRYLLLMNILENVRQKREEDQCDLFRMNYEREYFKKMRKKIQEGRKHPQPKSNLISRAVKRKNTLKENKYSIRELSKHTETVRAHSEILEAVKFNYKPFMEEPKEYTHVGEFSEDSEMDPLKLRKKPPVENEIPSIPIELLEYAKLALTQFRDIEDKFDRFYSGKIDYDFVPIFDVRIPIDEGEFRTAEKEDW